MRARALFFELTVSRTLSSFWTYSRHPTQSQSDSGSAGRQMIRHLSAADERARVLLHTWALRRRPMPRRGDDLVVFFRQRSELVHLPSLELVVEFLLALEFDGLVGRGHRGRGASRCGYYGLPSR